MTIREAKAIAAKAGYRVRIAEKNAKAPKFAGKVSTAITGVMSKLEAAIDQMESEFGNLPPEAQKKSKSSYTKLAKAVNKACEALEAADEAAKAFKETVESVELKEEK